MLFQLPVLLLASSACAWTLSALPTCTADKCLAQVAAHPTKASRYCEAVLNTATTLATTSTMAWAPACIDAQAGASACSCLDFPSSWPTHSKKTKTSASVTDATTTPVSSSVSMPPTTVIAASSSRSKKSKSAKTQASNSLVSTSATLITTTGASVNSISTPFPASTSTLITQYNGTSIANATSSMTTTITPVSITSFTSGFVSTPTLSSNPATSTATLVPAIHWDNDLSDLDNLVPQDSAMLYYAEKSGVQNPYLKHMYLNYTANFQYPTVILEHSEYVSAVECIADGIAIGFNYSLAFNTVQESWTTFPMLIVSFGDGCSTSATANYTRTYWLASDATFDDNIALVAAQEVLVIDGVANADLVWGIYTPLSNLTSGTSTSTGASTATGSSYPSCTPPSSSVNGLAAADWCLESFDSDLDTAIGFQDLSNSSFLDSLEKVAQGLPTVSSSSKVRRDAPLNIQDTISARRLAKRWCFDDCEYDVDGTIDVDMTLPDDDTSPWGDAFKIFKWSSDGGEEDPFETTLYDYGAVTSDYGYDASNYGYYYNYKNKRDEGEGGNDGESHLTESIALYCVGCGVTGSIDIYGSATVDYDPLDGGLESLVVGVEGSFTGVVQLGLVAEIEYQNTWTYQLLTLPVTPFEVLDLIAFGPEITLSAEFDLDVTLAGSVLAGAEVTWGPFQGQLDMIDSSNSYATGFNSLSHQYTVNASESITVSTEFSLPVSIGFGISIPYFHKSWDAAQLIEKPGIAFTVEYEIAGQVQDTDGTLTFSYDTDDDCNNGLDFTLNFQNDIIAEVADEWSITLFEYTYPLWTDCYAFDPQTSSNPNVTLIDSTSTYNFTALDSGSLYLTQLALDGSVTSFFSNESTLYGDIDGRYFHYYSDEMSTLGVSRLRLSTLDEVPNTATMVVLQPSVKTANSYSFVDANGGIYDPLACTITSDYNGMKVFLVPTDQDDAGAAAMMQTDSYWTVSGGTVTGCQYLPLIAGSA